MGKGCRNFGTIYPCRDDGIIIQTSYYEFPISPPPKLHLTDSVI